MKARLGSRRRRDWRRLRRLPVAMALALLGCVGRAPIAEGSLELRLVNVVAAAATVQATLVGPESRTISQVASDHKPQKLRFELLRPGAYEIEVSALFSASRVLQWAQVDTASVEAGKRTVLEVSLQSLVSEDAGPADAALSRDAGDRADTWPGADSGLDAGAEDAGVDGGAREAGPLDADEGDVAPPPARPQGRLVPGFPALFDGAGGDFDLGQGVAFGGDALWVVGSSVDAAQRARMALWRLNREGELAPGFPVLAGGAEDGVGADTGLAVALAADGAVWVSGASGSADTGADMALWRFDASGSLAPGFPVIRAGDAGGRGADRGRAIAVDADGAIWVAGESTNARGDLDLAVWKFLPNGGLAPGFPLLRDGDAGGQGHDRGLAIAVAADGQVWVAGSSTSAAGDRDLALWRFATDAALDPGFPKLWDSGQHTCAEGAALVVTATTLWVAGQVCVGDASTDMALWSFDLHGRLQGGSPWLGDGPGANFDALTAIAVDPAGGLWAAGRSVGMGGYYQAALLAFDHTGHLRPGFPWLYSDDAQQGQHQQVGALLMDPQAEIWLVGGLQHATPNLDMALWKFQ